MAVEMSQNHTGDTTSRSIRREGQVTQELNPHDFFGKIRTILADPNAILPRDTKDGTVTSLMREVLPVVDRCGFQQTFPGKTRSKLFDYFTNVDDIYSDNALPVDTYAKENGITKTAMEVRLYKTLRLLAQELPEERKEKYFQDFEKMFPNLIKVVDNTYYEPEQVASRRTAQSKEQAKRMEAQQEEIDEPEGVLTDEQKKVLEEIYMHFFNRDEQGRSYAGGYLRNKGLTSDFIEEVLDIALLNIANHLLRGHTISEIPQKRNAFIFHTLDNVRNDLVRKRVRKPSSSLEELTEGEKYQGAVYDKYHLFGMNDQSLEQA